jgi:hypothetical protein
MDCGTVKDRLVAARPPDANTLAHLAGCPECSAFAGRLEAVREAFRQPGIPVQPDSGFALRVVARLPSPAQVLGWAALRALPAALALALALAWMGLSQPPSPLSVLTQEPSLDLLFSYGTLAPEMER